MRQVRISVFGGIERLEIATVAEPVPAAGEVLVDVRACGLNFSDLVQREGLYVGGPTPPFVPGVEAAGIVIAHGRGVAAPAIGARVVVAARGGLQAERVAVPATSCIELPAAVDFTAAAGFAVSYLTAYHALVTVAHAAPGELVLVHAAAGGFGSAAVQIAKCLGLHVVATASTEEKRARVRALGAEAVGYDAFEAPARRAAIVLDSVGGDVFRKSLAILAPLGRLVTIGATSGETRPLDAVKLVFRSHAVLGFHLDAILGRPDLLAPSLAWLLPRLASGELVVQVGHTLPLAEIAEAHALLASRASYGKIVLVP